MLTTFPSAWLVLALPFVSAGVIAHAQPLRRLSAAHHRMVWSVGVVGLFAFLGGLAGLLPESITLAAVLLGGALAGFSCFWTASTDDADDWRRWSVPPGADEPPDRPIDWEHFDRLRAQWARRPRVRP